MRHKLAAVFDDLGKARQALGVLLASGYARSHVALWTGSTHDARRAAGLIAGFMHTGGEEVGMRPFGGRTDIDHAAPAACHFGPALHENPRYRSWRFSYTVRPRTKREEQWN